IGLRRQAVVGVVGEGGGMAVLVRDRRLVADRVVGIERAVRGEDRVLLRLREAGGLRECVAERVGLLDHPVVGVVRVGRGVAVLVGLAQNVAGLVVGVRVRLAERVGLAREPVVGVVDEGGRLVVFVGLRDLVADAVVG